MGDSKYERIFKRTYAHRDDDEVNVLKTQAVALPDKRAMFLMMFSKTGDKDNEGFVKTILRIGSMKNWMGLMEEISENSPADQIRLSNLGYGNINGTDYRLYLNKTHASRAYFKRFFRNRFSKALWLSDLLEKIRVQKSLLQKFVYPTVYDGIDITKGLNELNEDVWYTNTILTHEKGKERKKSRIIT